MRYKIADINTQFTEETIWSLPEGEHEVEFIDGIISMTNRQIILSFYYWELFRLYPGANYLKELAITGKYTSKTHSRLTNKIFWYVYNNAINKYKNLVWDMSESIYLITNKIYNMTCTNLSPYVTTACLHDLLEVVNDPAILEAKDKYIKIIDRGELDTDVIGTAISEVHDVVSGILYNDDNNLKNNGIKKLCNADVLSKGQVLQLVGPRGYLHDIDGEVFQHPINVGYIEGLRTLVDSAIESRSAARAIYANTAPLKNSEYFNREMQLLSSSLNSVQGECCKGFVTIPYLVEKGDLPLLKGKYFMDEDIPTMIWDSIDDLIGKYINIRTVTGCGNKNTQSVCKTCLGWSHLIIPPGTNLGYALSTGLCAIITQLILSTKHYEVSSAAKELELPKNSSRFLRLNRQSKGKIFLTKAMANRNPIIRLDLKSSGELNNILSVDIDELPPSRITNCLEIGIVDTDNNGIPVGPMENIKLEVSGSGSHLTTEILHYLKEHRWTSHNKYIEFRLKDWDYTVPVFSAPNKGDNVQLFLKEVKMFIIPQKKSEIKITDFKTRGAATSEFIQLLRKRIPINMIQAEIFIRACMCTDPDAGDYTLPHSKSDFKFVSVKQALLNRSLTGLLSYQEQSRVMFNPHWFMDYDRTDHMLDPIIEIK